jgi:serine/threonine protein kinase
MSPADDDDEKTITGPLTPGRERTGMQAGHVLPRGTRLRDYELTGLIGEGGFGIVYLAWDHSLQRQVAIKEYMPASMAARVAGSSAIVVKSERHLDTFRAGLKSFVNEARLLARFDHSALVKVYRFWEENGTAYMVMPYYEGPTLKAALAALGRSPSEAELRAWLGPLLDALGVMHAAHCFHRDIAPDNILLTPRGPLLLDFGAARRVIGDMTHAITVVLKPGFAPIEQYGDVATMSQGAWTDLYALASVVHYAIEGRTPISSVERLMDDRLVPLSVSAGGRYSEPFLAAIDAALAVRPADRPQSARAFRALLDAGLPPESVAPERDSGWTSGYSTLSPPLAPELPTQLLAPRATGAVRSSEQVVARSEEAVAPRAAPRGRRWTIAALALGAVLVAGAIVGALQPRVDAPSAPRPAAPASAAGDARAEPAAPTAAVTSRASETAPVVIPEPAAAALSGPGADERRTTEAPAPANESAAAPPTPVEREERNTEAAGGRERAAAATSAPTPSARAARPQREAAQRNDSAAVPPRPAQRTAPAIAGRCSDILQKASLEPLTADEAEYLRRECR